MARSRPVKSHGGHFLGKKINNPPAVNSVPAGRFPVMAGSRTNYLVNSRDGKFPREEFPWRPFSQKIFHEFPWWLNPTGKNPKIKIFPRSALGRRGAVSEILFSGIPPVYSKYIWIINTKVSHLGQLIDSHYSTTVHRRDPPGRADVFLICMICMICMISLMLPGGSRIVRAI